MSTARQSFNTQQGFAGSCRISFTSQKIWITYKAWTWIFDVIPDVIPTHYFPRLCSFHVENLGSCHNWLHCSIIKAGSWISFWWESSLKICSMLSLVRNLQQLWMSMISNNSSWSTSSKSERQDLRSLAQTRIHIWKKRSLSRKPKTACSRSTGASFTGRYFSFCQPNVIIKPTISPSCMPKSWCRYGTLNLLARLVVWGSGMVIVSLTLIVRRGLAKGRLYLPPGTLTSAKKAVKSGGWKPMKPVNKDIPEAMRVRQRGIKSGTSGLR